MPISISLSKDAFAAGELLEGEVVVELEEEVAASELKLVLHGVEEARFSVKKAAPAPEGGEAGGAGAAAGGEGGAEEEKKVEWETVEVSETVLDEELLEEAIDGGKLSAGRHTWSFDEELPPKLAATVARITKLREDGEENFAAVRYWLEASLVGSDCSTCVDVQMYEPAKADKPVEAEDSAQVLWQCVVPRGTATMRVSLPHSVVSPGEELAIRVEIDNDTPSTITHINVRHRNLVAIVNGGKVRSLRVDGDEVAHEGVKQRTKIDRTVPFTVPEDCPLTAASGLVIRHKLRLYVRCDLAPAPDLEVVLPVTVVPASSR